MTLLELLKIIFKAFFDAFKTVLGSTETNSNSSRFLQDSFRLVRIFVKFLETYLRLFKTRMDTKTCLRVSKSIIKFA